MSTEDMQPAQNDPSSLVEELKRENERLKGAAEGAKGFGAAQKKRADELAIRSQELQSRITELEVLIKEREEQLAKVPDIHQIESRHQQQIQELSERVERQMWVTQNHPELSPILASLDMSGNRDQFQTRIATVAERIKGSLQAERKSGMDMVSSGSTPQQPSPMEEGVKISDADLAAWFVKNHKFRNGTQAQRDEYALMVEIDEERRAKKIRK